MTAEERMRERAAQVCDEAHAFDANERGGKHGVAHGLASEIRALPLEGEQDQRAPIKYRAELIFDHETRIIHGTIDEPQGEPAEDQRGAAAIPTDTRAATVSDGAASKYRVEHDPSQSAPHHQRAERVKADARSVSQDDPASAHHSRTEQALVNAADGIDAVSQGRCKPAPAREPVHNDWSKAKAKVLAKYPAAQYEAMQGYLPPYGHIVWINHKRDAPSDRGYGLSNATSEQEAWLEAARNLPAPAREPAVEEALRLYPERWRAGKEYSLAYEHAAELDRLRAENAAWSECWKVVREMCGDPLDSPNKPLAMAATVAILHQSCADLREQLQGGVVVPRGGANALLEWSGAEPSQSVLSRAADDWINAS